MLLLELKNTAAGFGCRFGSDEGKVRILNVLAPFRGEKVARAGYIPNRSARITFPQALATSSARRVRTCLATRRPAV